MSLFYVVEQEPSREEIIVDTITRIASSALRRGYMPHGKAFNVCSRDIGNCLYEYPSTYTGYASKESLSTKYYNAVVLNNTKYRFTYDHIWPRQYAGTQIILTVKEYGVAVKAIVRSLVVKYSQIRYVTPDENNRLSKFQDAKDFTHPDLAYQQAGVEVVPWPAGTKITKLPELYPDLASSAMRDINSNS